jgi:hypothetical protein
MADTMQVLAAAPSPAESQRQRERQLAAAAVANRDVKNFDLRAFIVANGVLVASKRSGAAQAVCDAANAQFNELGMEEGRTAAACAALIMGRLDKGTVDSKQQQVAFDDLLEQALCMRDVLLGNDGNATAGSLELKLAGVSMGRLCLKAEAALGDALHFLFGARLSSARLSLELPPGAQARGWVAALRDDPRGFTDSLVAADATVRACVRACVRASRTAGFTRTHAFLQAAACSVARTVHARTAARERFRTDARCRSARLTGIRASTSLESWGHSKSFYKRCATLIVSCCARHTVAPRSRARD